MNFTQIFFASAAISAASIFAAIKIFPRIWLLDFPEKYGLQRARLPFPGGLVFLILAGGIFFDENFLVLFFPLLILGILSFIDDRRPLPAILRLFFQIAVAAAIFFGGVKISFFGNPFAIFFENISENFELAQFPLFSFLLTIFWILSIQNAMNFFDGAPGLAVGVSAVGFLTLGILGIARPELFFDPSQKNLIAANFFLAGICAGGFYFFWRQKIILGDTGSQILGFLLAAMSIFSGAKIATTFLVLAPPILDAFFVIFRRIFFEKKSPFRGDLRHLHHNLSRKISEKSAVILLIFLSAIFGAIAIFLQNFSKLIALIFAAIFVFCLNFWAQKK